MENAERLVNKAAEIHEFASEIARMITGAQMPEFSSENMSVADASKLIGLPAAAIRAGIVYRWLPIGMAIHNNKSIFFFNIQLVDIRKISYSLYLDKSKREI